MTTMIRNLPVFIVGVMLATAILSFAQSAGVSTKSTFSINVSAAPSFPAGTPIVINITATNVSTHVIAFDAMAVYGERNFNIDVADANGKRAPETQYLKAIRGESQGAGPQLVLGGQLVQRDLAPGATLKWSVDMTKLYNLQPGTYTVSVWRPDWQTGHDQFDIPRSSLPPTKPTAADLHPTLPPPKAIAKSNVVTITVVP